MAVDGLNLLIDKQLADKVDGILEANNLTMEDLIKTLYAQISTEKAVPDLTAFVKSQLASTETK
ncbi:hypothetical protein ACFQ44_12630 [Levilactobacillus lanxiensis]|uniref:Peptidylprolyl isomerase n=1 Tax=Levilactobacillus lanxiensis TaxID=2799568 RepID=A0ABW4D6R8_9LACO|nr:hypothetical protein [Levilactobacillus lanxiensis]